MTLRDATNVERRARCRSCNGPAHGYTYMPPVSHETPADFLKAFAVALLLFVALYALVMVGAASVQVPV